MQVDIAKGENYPQGLVALLSKRLTSAGFWHFPYMNYFVRDRHGVRDVIGWEKKSATDAYYALYFGVWVPEFEEVIDLQNIDESVDIRNVALMHDLSEQCVPALNYCWQERDGVFLQEQVLLNYIEQVALPYFDTFSSLGDVAEMIFLDPRFHNSALEQRLMASPFSSLFNYEIEKACDQVVALLKPLQKNSPAFEYSGGYFWRKRNDVFDVIVPEYFAAWRFVRIKTAVWHPRLDGIQQVPNTLPSGVSCVAWRIFSQEGEDASLLPPAFLGECECENTSLTSQIQGLRTHGLAWLEKIVSFNDVKAAIRPEFKIFFPD